MTISELQLKASTHNDYLVVKLLIVTATLLRYFMETNALRIRFHSGNFDIYFCHPTFFSRPTTLPKYLYSLFK
jgi:hypothetical protein